MTRDENNKIFLEHMEILKKQKKQDKNFYINMIFLAITLTTACFSGGDNIWPTFLVMGIWGLLYIFRKLE